MKKYFYTSVLFCAVAGACFFTLGIYSKEEKAVTVKPKVEKKIKKKVQPILEVDKQAVEKKEVKAVPVVPAVEPKEKKIEKKVKKKLVKKEKKKKVKKKKEKKKKKVKKIEKKKTPVLEPDKPAKKINDMWLIDKIVVRVNGVNIYKSTLDEPQIAKDGDRFTLQEAIYHELLFQRAAEMHVLPSGTDVQRQIVSLKMQRGIDGMSDEEFEKELKESGFTVAMYRRQLGRLIAVENVKRMEVDDKAVVTTQEVEAYHKKNPEYDKESYHLRIASIPKDKKDDYKELIKEGKLSWSDKGWIAKEELDERFSFVSKMKKGKISKPIDVGNRILLFHVVDRKDRKPRELTHRYSAIEKLLREQKRTKFIDEFLNGLETKASIVYL